jgi:hypothetical protein|tara:strand:+ start:715 stop:891 length:177 start_codon:yes stop_codon:yes gene_type:complete
MGHRLDRVGFETNTETETGTGTTDRDIETGTIDTVTGHLEGIDLPVFRAIGKDKSSLC